MATTQNSNWSTSFFYEQDLRSEYMNGILNSALRPGIYNANMFLYTTTSESGTTGSNGGVNLHIKKDTTFIFSNNYDKLTSGDEEPYERNLSDVGSYLIKSTVLSDVDINLIELRTSGTITDATRNILGVSTQVPAAKSFYVVAVMEYSGDNGDSTYSIPTFKCVVKNPEYTGEGEDSNLYYYLVRSRDSENSSYLLPDGMKDDSRIDKKVAYLILGEVRDINYQTGLYYAISNDSGGQSWRSDPGALAWTNNHIFTGKGLPDYRQSYLFDKDQESPDIIYQRKTTGDILYVDVPSLSTQDLLFKERADWRAIAGIGPYASTGTSNYLSYNFASDTSLATDISNFSGAGVVADVFFLSTRSRYSDSESIEIQRLFSSQDPADGFVKELKLKHFRWISGCVFSNLDPRYAVEGGSKIPNGYISSMTQEIAPPIVPLDISAVNRDRLLLLLENRNVLPAVINYLRQNNKIAPEEETSLIPVAIVFRKFDSNKNFVDSVSSPTSVDPSNTLNFFDLQYKTSRINNVTIDAQDVYSVIPVME